MKVRKLTKQPLSAAKVKNGPNHVYVLSAGPLVKIGISRDVAARAASIHGNSPYPIEIVRHWQTPFARELEGHALELLEAYRTKGEWLSIPPRLATVLIALLIVIRPRTAPMRRMFCKAILLCTVCPDHDHIKSPATKDKTYICRKCSAPMQAFNLNRKASIYRTADASRGSVGFDGRFEVGSRQVDDPLVAGQRTYAAVNVRESAIDHLVSRRRINAAQAFAGDRFRRLWELSAVGSVKGIDPTKDVVDGNGSMEPVTDARLVASQELKTAIQAIGLSASRVLISVLEEGSIEKAASRWSSVGGIVSGRRAEGYITGTLVDALSNLVKHWKLEGTGSGRRAENSYKRNGKRERVVDSIVASSASFSGPVFEISVDKFGDTERRQIRPVDKAGTVHISSGADIQKKGSGTV